MRFTKFYPLVYIPLMIGISIWYFKPVSIIFSILTLLSLIMISIPLGIVLQLKLQVIRD